MDCGQNMQGCVVPSLSFLVRSRATKLRLSSGIISTFERPPSLVVSQFTSIQQW